MRRGFLATIAVFYAALIAALVLGPQVFAKWSPPPPATCTGTLSHTTTNDLTVPVGAVCRVSGSTVNGSVTVGSGAYFEASTTRIAGNLRATSALTVFLHDGTSVGGSVVISAAPQLFLYKTDVAGTVKVSGAIAPGFGHVQVCATKAGQIEVTGSGPDVLVGDPQSGCPGNKVKRDIVITGNDTKSELDVSGNTVAGSLTVTGNLGSSPKHVTGNVVLGAVSLSDNAAPFDSSSNG